MADPLSKSDAVLVVTLRTLLSADGVELPGLEAAIGPAQQEDLARYQRIVEKLREETARTGSDVLITVQDRDTSMLQSLIAEEGDAGPPLPGGGLEAKFGTGLTGGDIGGWFRSVFDWIDQSQWHPIVRPPDNKVGTLADTGRVALLGDWGTNLYGAPVSAASIIARPVATSCCCISATSTIPAPSRR